MTKPLRITVIGGAGFVGTSLCRRFEDHQIAFEIIDAKPSKSFPERSKIADVRQIDSLRSTMTGNLVINLAAVHRDDVRDKKDYYRTNVLGAENITRVCSEKAIKKIIFASSVAVYGAAKMETTESAQIKPFNEYGRTKYEAEERFRLWRAQEGSSLIIVRPTVIFGEGNRGNVYNLIAQIASKRFVMVGPGTNRKAMAYVGNVAAFLHRLVSLDESYAVFNYADTPHLDMNTLVRHVRRSLNGNDDVGIRIPYPVGLAIGGVADFAAKVTGRKFNVSAIRVRKFCMDTVFSSATIKRVGFNAPYSLSEGLERTLRSEFILPDPDREIFITE